MRNFIISILIGASSSFAETSFIVSLPCEIKPAVETTVQSYSGTIGTLTIELLQNHNIPFEGTSDWIKSIASSPMDDDAMEVISDNEMNVYGWCYSIDGTTPDALAGEIPFEETITQVKWFFGYAKYKDGVWVSSCSPIGVEQEKFLCH